MKFLFLFASFIIAIGAVSDEEAWAKFKVFQQDFSKEYRSLREEKLRYEIFKDNLAAIEEHNAKYENGEESYDMGINQFTDLTDEEFREKYLNYNYQPLELNSTETFEAPEDFTAPDSIDWRQKGAVLSVKNQGSCGSCWTFSVVAAVEGQNAIKHKVKTDLSEQELVDCDTSYNKGCSGGVVVFGFNYIKANGISTLSSYPYVGKDMKCSKSSHPRSSVKVTGYKTIVPLEKSLQAAVASVGPIAVGVVGDKLKSYKSGVFDNIFCGSKPNHAVLAVGYGTANNKPYWLVKNSWGTSWGEQGYIRMTRNKLNQCAIATAASYPIIA